MLRLLYLMQVISLLNGDYQTAVDLLISRIYRNSRKGHGMSQEDKAETTRISMKMHVRHIAEIVWYDANIAWKLEDYENVKVVTVQSPYLWMPQLRILNSVNDSLISYGVAVPVKVWSAGYVYTSPEVMVSTDCSMEASSYPTDEHDCPILLAPTGKDTESVSLGTSANPELNLYWPSSGKKEGKKLSVGQWEIVNVTQKEETYNLREESWKDFAIGKDGTDVQVLKVTVRFRRRIPHFRYTVVLPAAVAATFNTVAMYPSSNFLLTLMVLFPNLLLQCVLTAYLLKDMPIATAEAPRISKY
ncbi:Neur chan LBD domain containing protein [Trichuris trichiura]|uniref:Neur chan LBD domain containing protein n=1 Tax=Trichuris trichiura TaxID=36087 RepID=A0A077ZA24_TRITR|nr:Neur chan LBD domain containing protein [Trichuris trichiura]